MRRFPEGGLLKLKDLPEKFIQNILAEEGVDDYLPDLPLPLPLDEYIEQIKQRARSISDGKMSEVDRLLNQKLGTEKQRQYRLRKS